MKLVRVLGFGDWRGPAVQGRRRFGVPPGGPWDRELAALARGMLGQLESEPVFELLWGTAEFALGRSGTVSCIGLQGEFLVDDIAVPIGTRLPVTSGTTLRVQSNLAYIGFTPDSLAKSRLDRLPKSSGDIRFLPAGNPIDSRGLVMDAASSRAGVRINGLPRKDMREIPSEPTCVGAIQRTSSGQLIIIGPDGPTIGGYPKIGTVIEADLDLVARLLPGQSVHLKPVELQTALEESGRKDAELASRLGMIRSSAQR